MHFLHSYYSKIANTYFFMFEGKISQAKEFVPSFFKDRIYALIWCLKKEEVCNKAVSLVLKCLYLVVF